MTPTEARALADCFASMRLPLTWDTDAYAALRSLADQVEALQHELWIISLASRFDKELFANDSEFADWAQSRARNAASKENT